MGRHVRVPVAVARGRHAVHRPRDDGLGQDGHRGLPLREVDVLPLARAGAMEQGGEDGDGAVEAARRVAVRDADVHRRPAAVAGHRGEAGERHLRRPVRHLVAVGPRRAVARQRDHDDVGAERAQHVVAEPHALHDPGREVLDHDVARGAQPPGHGHRLGALEIERDALLALIVLVEVAAPVRAGSRRVTQSRVAVSMRITSAPRCASWSVQNGPAHTHVKSATRRPASGARRTITRRRRPPPRRGRPRPAPRPCAGRGRGQGGGSATAWPRACRAPRAW